MRYVDILKHQINGLYFMMNTSFVKRKIGKRTEEKQYKFAKQRHQNCLQRKPHNNDQIAA